MSTKFRRGFKTEADSYAKEFRQELQIKPHEPLCPWRLAQHLAIPVRAISSYHNEIPEPVRYCMAIAPDFFSAITIFNNYRRLIIHNDAHHPYRQAANIAHELSHGILGHMPSTVFDQYGNRHFDEEHEAEANWLGPTLLLPKEAAIHIIKQRMSNTEASKAYGVSQELLRMRINVSGATAIVKRIQQKRASVNRR
jgi:Zn-dependent peptidase ImmA (M78 family)